MKKKRRVEKEKSPVVEIEETDDVVSDKIEILEEGKNKGMIDTPEE